jgi:pimeloyl-ACP methyl ester carboxylesterase
MRRLSCKTPDGIELSVLAGGDGGDLAPVLLVHGLSSNARLWDGVGGELAILGHPVAAVDQRGHGSSGKPSSGYDFATLTDDLLAVMDQLGWRGALPYAVGQSWGGNVVLELAARQGHGLRGAVLVDGGTIELSARFADWPTCEAAMAPPPIAGTPVEEFERMIRMQHPDWPEAGIQATLANVEVLGDGTIRPWLSRDNHLKILREMWDQRPSDLYPMVAVPVLMLMAEDPTNQRWMSGKREGVERAGALLPESETRWIVGDHDLHAQHPGLVASLVHEASTRPAAA